MDAEEVVSVWKARVRLPMRLVQFVRNAREIVGDSKLIDE